MIPRCAPKRPSACPARPGAKALEETITTMAAVVERLRAARAAGDDAELQRLTEEMEVHWARLEVIDPALFDHLRPGTVHYLETDPQSSLRVRRATNSLHSSSARAPATPSQTTRRHRHLELPPGFMPEGLDIRVGIHLGRCPAGPRRRWPPPRSQPAPQLSRGRSCSPQREAPEPPGAKRGPSHRPAAATPRRPLRNAWHPAQRSSARPPRLPPEASRHRDPPPGLGKRYPARADTPAPPGAATSPPSLRASSHR